MKLLALSAALLVAVLLGTASADTLTNAKTGEVVRGALLGTSSAGGQDQYRVKLDDGTDRTLPKAEPKDPKAIVTVRGASGGTETIHLTGADAKVEVEAP
jgi:hypothetical protein